MAAPIVVACIPAYNVENRIGPVLEKTRDLVDLTLVCDDGSTDLTPKIAELYGAQVIRHEKNRGYGGAIKSLFEAAKLLNAEIIVTLDSDGQHKPEDIVRLVNHMVMNKFDIVIGSRFMESSTKFPLWRKFGISVINKLTSNDSKISDTQSGFRAYSRKAIQLLDLEEGGMGISTEILLKAEKKGLSIGEVPIEVLYFEDSSTHNPVVHGLSVVYSSLKHMSVERPLVYIGPPFIVSMLLFNLIILGSVYGVETVSAIIEDNMLLMITTLISVGASVTSRFKI